MGGGPNLTPYIIYQEVYLSPLSLWKTNIYIYIYIHSLGVELQIRNGQKQTMGSSVLSVGNELGPVFGE